MRANPMIVAGVMSGTSADGIDVALVRFRETPATDSAHAPNFPVRGRISRARKSRVHPSFELLGHAQYAYPGKVRDAVLASMNAEQAKVADLARLNFLLGDLYADAVLATQRKFRVRADLVGCHGQTLYHQSEPQTYLGRKIAATWQMGEAAVIAAKVGAPVVSDFRPADMAAGGKGAPLVPFLDYLLFRDPRVGRIVQNIGGIANLTTIFPGAAASDVIAFDTGPGNMVIDAVTDKLFARPFDRDGKIAASGRVLNKVIDGILSQHFFRQPPPKTAGREEFGRKFVLRFLRSVGAANKQDAVATATALTARSIADAVRNYASKRGSSKRVAWEMILSGGGAQNRTLVSMLGTELAPLGVRLRLSDEFGLPSAAKEAVAFAILAHETWCRRPSNMPSATGAKRAAVLGKISFP